jgi:hypothetical protein
LDQSFTSTRESLRAVACYVLAPARKARTGHISLEPTPDGFGTPPLDDGERLAVRGDRLFGRDGATIRLTTLRAAARFARIELTPDPGVGHDLPAYTPDVALRVHPAASIALGAWYAFGQSVFDQLLDRELRTRVAPQIWPEHFDLAITLDLGERTNVNVGFSPGMHATQSRTCMSARKTRHA